MSGITLKDVLEKLENAIELEDWNIVQELLNDIEMELEYTCLLYTSDAADE